jgi:hypothetical protein
LKGINTSIYEKISASAASNAPTVRLVIGLRPEGRTSLFGDGVILSLTSCNLKN